VVHEFKPPALPGYLTKQAENKIDWFITEEYTGIIKFSFPCDRIHLSGPLAFQYNAHGINKPLPIIA
jgi:hypothetical protein